MSGCSRRNVRAVVGEHLRAVRGSRGQVEQAGRASAVVGVLVPFVAKRSQSGPEGQALPGAERCHRGVAPQPQRGVLRGHLDVRRTGVDDEELPREGIFRPASVGGWTEPGITPGPGPRRRVLGIRGRVEVRLLVGHQRPSGSFRTIRARLPARLPEHLVAAEEGEVHSAGSRRLHAGTLIPGPVLVVADGKKGLVVGQQSTAGGGVQPTDVTEVISVRLEPANHRVLAVHQPASA